eukprot:Skav202746  [mRNA]  locus=scaffold1326:432347:438898:- [translate_table: standard]
MRSTLPVTSAKKSLPERLNEGCMTMRHHGNTRRVTCFHWNSGGLSAGQYDELLVLLRERGVDIATISETHWSLNKTWSSSGWHVHHSSSTSKGDGMMILISAKRWPSHCLGWEVISPGRLVHIRIRLHTRHIDSIHCYQYADRHDAHRKGERDRWWGALDQLLSTLPVRNTLVLQGDFNSSLQHCSGMIGMTCFKLLSGSGCGTAHQDMDRLERIVRKYRLVALNTWSTTCASYRHHDTFSRIDHVMTRLEHVDSTAKRVHHDWDFPLITNPLHTHFPQIASIACDRHWKPPPSDSFTLQQRLKGRSEWLHDSSCWQSFEMQSRQTLHSVDTSHDPTPVLTIHDRLSTCFKSHFCSPSNPDQIDKTQFQNKWGHRWKATHQPQTLSGIFRAWFHWSRFQSACKQQQAIALKRRELRAEQLIEEAQCASDRHDQFQLYQLINRYSPKTTQMKIQLKHNGMMLTPTEAHQHLVEYVRTTWDGPDDSWYTPKPLTAFPFSFEELVDKLQRTPISKAVAVSCVPDLALRAAAHEIATILMPLLHSWWMGSEVFIPNEWKTSWVIWLPKPKKPPCVAANLRAIALQEPIGKQVLGILVDQSMTQALPQLVRWTQFAFLPLRGTAEALLRVQQHCSMVRDLLRISHRHVADRAGKLIPSGCFGGVQVSLDMTRAFDCLDRAYLFTQLWKVGIHGDLCQLLSAWHTATSYQVSWESLHSEVSTHIGMRQGCKGAPFLWAVLVTLVLQDLADDTTDLTRDWLIDHVTFYADDLHIGCVVHQLEDLTRFVQFTGLIIEKLQSLGLQISAAKSTAMISLRGAHHQKQSRSYIHITNQGRWLLIPVGASQIRIPIVQSFTYLGTVLSYGGFELQTTKHRLQSAWQAFHRLRRWLLCRKLKFLTRHRIWQSSVLSILLYGLWPIGVTEKCATILIQAIFTMYRRMLHNHAYHTGDSHMNILTRHQLEHPCALLCRAIVTFKDRIEARDHSLANDDVVKTLSWHHLHSNIALLSFLGQDPPTALVLPLPDDSGVMHPTFACPHCTVTCHSIANLRRHMTHVHGVQVHRTFRCNPGLHAVEGLPQCVHCLQSFASWRSFETHLERRCCDRPLQDTMVGHSKLTDDRVSLIELIALKQKPFGTRLLQLIEQQNWQAFKTDSEILQYLQHHCCLCGFWFDKTQQYLAHVKHRHPRLLQHTLAKSTQLTSLLGGHSPCSMCGGNFKNSHLCVVATQIAKLYVHGAALTDTAGEAGIFQRLRCEICQEQFSDEKTLAYHLSVDHLLWTHNWIPSRDTAKPGNTCCAHCDRELGSLSNLRAHITAGYCLAFNPARVPESCPLPTDWIQEIQLGTIAHVVRTDKAATLNRQCLHCNEEYSRVQDLTAHLQQCHSLVLEEASPWIAMFQELLYPITNCVCRPMTVGSVTHQCLAWIQLGMVCARAKLAFVLPYEIPMTLLQMKLDLMDCPQHRELCRLLVERDFERLWQSQAVLQCLSTRCMFCGEDMEASQLHWHLMLVHHSDLQWAGAVLPLLIPLLHPTWEGPSCCLGCGLAYRVPPELHSMETQPTDLLSLHLRFQCPASLQIALILTIPSHGRRRNARGLGRDATGVPLLQTHGTSDGEHAVRPPHGSRHQKAQSSRTRAGKRSRSRRRDSTATDSSGPCSPGLETGARAAGLASPRFFCNLFQPRRSSSAAAVGGTNPEMAGSKEAVINTIVEVDTPTSPSAAHADGTPTTHPSDEQQQTGGCLTAAGDRPSGLDPGWMLSISPLGQGPEMPGEGPAAWDPYEEDGGNGGPADRGHDRRGGSDSEVPLLEGPKLGPHCSMEDAGVDAKERILLHHEDSERKPGMASPGCQSTTPCPTPVPTGTGSCTPDWEGTEGPERQRPGEEQGEGTSPEEAGPMTKTQYMIHLVLSNLLNEGRYCYANSTFLTWLWMHLSRDDFAWVDLGPYEDQFRALLACGDTHPFRLYDVVGMRQVMTEWDRFLGQHGQSDSGEFLTYMLEHDSIWSPCYQMQWHRRELCHEQAKVKDTNALASPTKLQFDLATMHHKSIHLNDLFQTWTQVDGMITAYVERLPQMICVHLDRFWMSEDGSWQKVHTPVMFEDTIQVPCFQDDTMCAEKMSYKVVSATCHSGVHHHGHYTSIVRISTFSSDTWILKDDNCPPAFSPDVPHWVTCGVNLLWLLPVETVDRSPLEEVLKHLRGT